MRICFAFALILLLFGGCSSEQTTITGNVYHNLTAHYNGFYYAREKIHEIEQLIAQSMDDDPNQVLRLYPKLDTTLAKTYEKDTEEAIKMASLSIQRHPKSRWVDDNYIMVGLARLYSLDFVNAIQTFKYVNTKSTDLDTRHQALVHLIRTFTENGEYTKAEEAFRFLDKEPLSQSNAKKLFLEKAYYYQVMNDYDNMVRNLTRADSLLGNKDEKSRIYFIIGQVYQKLGFESEAYNYYRKCIATNPPYELDFYARLNMAQVARLDDSRDVRTVRKQFEKMLADTKNTEFRDKIYYELAEFERKQGNLSEAVAGYKQAAHSGNSKRVQGSAYLRLGQIHFDSLKKYSLAKSYYDSAVSSLPRDFENYESIKKRQEVLAEFAKYTETIEWQDSLLRMASIDSVTLRLQLDSVLTARIKKQEVVKKRKKRTSNSAGGNGNQSNPFFLEGSQATLDWYFGNLSAVALGQTEFKRIWGNIALEDNWRRSNKSVINQPAAQEVATAAVAETKGATTPEANNNEQLNNLFLQLPLSDISKKEALAKIEDAYFNLGDIFFFKLNEKQNAIESYSTLLERFPETALAAEVIYKLYLISHELKNGKENDYYQRLIQGYPQSSFAKVLLNPQYLKETQAVAEKQMALYKEAYEDFENGRSKNSQEKITEALALGETTFTPQLELLRILITGKTEDITRYQFELDGFLKKYPDDPLRPYAETLLASSKNLQQKTEMAGSIRYASAPDQPHYFAISHLQQSRISDPLSSLLNQVIQQHFKGSKLEISHLVLNEAYVLTLVSEFPNAAAAVGFFDRFNDQTRANTELGAYNFNIFVITKNNSDILYRTKALDEYLTFFDRTYKVKNQ